MIDLTLAREHLKADDEDIEDALIQQYIDSAVSICENFCNRKFYEDAASQLTDFDLALTELSAARDTLNTLITDNDDELMVGIYNDRYIRQRANALFRINGLVIDNTITAAVLMLLGHLYRNRQEVVVGQVNALHVPIGARRILEPYLWIGDLAGGGS